MHTTEPIPGSVPYHCHDFVLVPLDSAEQTREGGWQALKEVHAEREAGREGGREGGEEVQEEHTYNN